MRHCVVDLEVQGDDGYCLVGSSSMDQISRDPDDLGQSLNANHQYPDGFPVVPWYAVRPYRDRDGLGAGFTHKPGDRVRNASSLLGQLHNQVTTSDQAAPWTFGLGAMMRNLAARGLLQR